MNAAARLKHLSLVRGKTLAPHELEQEREAFLGGVVVDHLDGVVGEMID